MASYTLSYFCNTRAFHTNKPHIHFRERGYFWTHKPTPSTFTIPTLFTVPTSQSCLHLTIHQSHWLPQYGHFSLSPSVQAICILPSTQTDELAPMCVSTFLGLRSREWTSIKQVYIFINYHLRYFPHLWILLQPRFNLDIPPWLLTDGLEQRPGSPMLKISAATYKV